MLVIGLDAASDFRKFGYAIGKYRANGPVEILEAGLLAVRGRPDVLQSLLAPAIQKEPRVLLAIDAPLGWPQALGASVAHHVAGASLNASKDKIFRRQTENVVKRVTGKTALEVGADKIARATHSALSVLNELRIHTGQPIPLAWSIRFRGAAAIEVYPGATLQGRGIRELGYKKSGSSGARLRIAGRLGRQIAGLRDRVNDPVDVFDACLCLLAAKDFMDGVALSPTPDQLQTAKKEGWIWVRPATD